MVGEEERPRKDVFEEGREREQTQQMLMSALGLMVQCSKEKMIPVNGRCSMQRRYSKHQKDIGTYLGVDQRGERKARLVI